MSIVVVLESSPLQRVKNKGKKLDSRFVGMRHAPELGS